MTAKQLMLPAHRAFDSDGAPEAGATAHLYLSGTLTPALFYEDAALTISLGSTITANAAGRFDPMPYQDASIAFRIIIEDSEGAVLDDIDPFYFGLVTGVDGVSPTVTSRANLAALAVPTGNDVVRYLSESGREGNFVWRTGDYSTKVTKDPAQALYVAPSSAPTGASGAWVREYSGGKDPRWFGAMGDGVTDDKVALQRWLDSGGALFLPYLKFYSSDTLYVRNSVTIKGAGYVFDGVNGDTQGILGARIAFAAGKRGLDIQPQTALTDVATVVGNPVAAFTQEGAAYAEFYDFALIGGGGATAEGWHQRTNVFATNIYVTNFSGKGYHITATSDIPNADDEYGNASATHFLNCHAVSNGGDGLHVQGRDANNCQFTNFESRGNGGWGIREEGLLGNLYVKPILHGNLNAIKATGAVSANVFDFPYVEGDSGSACQIGGQALTVGSNFTSINTPPDAKLTTYAANQTIVKDITINWNFGSSGVALTGTDFGRIVGVADNGLWLQGKGGALDLILANRSGGKAFGVVGNTTDCIAYGNLDLYKAGLTTLNIQDTNGTGPGSHIQFLQNGARQMQIYAGNNIGYISCDTLNFRNQSTSVTYGTWSSTGLNLASGMDLSSNGTVIPLRNTTASKLIGRGSAGAGVAQEITLGGSLSMSGTTVGVATSGIVYAMIQNVAASRLLGNPTGGAAAPSEISLAGGLAFSGTTLTAAGALTPTSVASTGAVTSSSASAGIGYATGAGGTVTQITSRTTGVTLNKLSGAITLVSAAGSASFQSFTVTNSSVAATDTISINQKSGTDLYIIHVTNIAAGSFKVSFATTGGTTTEQPVFQFNVIKGVNA